MRRGIAASAGPLEDAPFSSSTPQVLRMRTAIHEAAHFVVASLRGVRAKEIRINAPRDGHMLPRSGDVVVNREDWIAILLAGYHGERELRATPIADAVPLGRNDFTRANEMCEREFGGRAGAELARINNQVADQVRDHSLAVSALASALFRVGHLSGEDARRVLYPLLPELQRQDIREQLRGGHS